jgi:hypothetical protein
MICNRTYCGKMEQRDGLLRVAIHADVLDYLMLADVLRLAELRLGPNTDRLELDCSLVRQFSGPWGVHFALALNFAKNHRLRVTFTCLAGQPLSLVHLFAYSPLLRSLVDHEVLGGASRPAELTRSRLPCERRVRSIPTHEAEEHEQLIDPELPGCPTDGPSGVERCRHD